MTMTTRFHPLLGVSLLALCACTQPTVPTASAPLQAPRYTVQALAPETALEDALFARINAERRRNGLRPVAHSPAMQRLARQHSLDMATRHYFGHTNLKGVEPYFRMKATGIPFTGYGETESHRPVGSNVVDDTITDWAMHRYGTAYTLRPDFTEAGVGVYRDGRYYDITVEWRRP
jgi:uncharacterized protein YkwD